MSQVAKVRMFLQVEGWGRRLEERLSQLLTDVKTEWYTLQGKG